MKYKRTDLNVAQNEHIVYKRSSKLDGLAESVEYEISVAGMTIKGVGVFSSKITISTKEDGKKV